MRSLLLLLCFGSAALAASPAPTPFSREVTRAVPDWVAEDWRQGAIKLHPSKFTWQSDVYLELLAAEPADGRAPQAALKTVWGNAQTDDDKVNMDGSTEIAPGILARRIRWKYAFDDNLSAWGIVATPRGFVPFHLNCEYAHPDRYTGEQCLRSAGTLLVMVKQGTLRVPEAPTPLSIAGWNGQYLSDGTSVATAASFNGLRRATITASMPSQIERSALRAATQRFADALIQKDDKVPGPTTWISGAEDSWLRRGFPQAFEGPALQLAGPVRLPDGRVVMVGLRCPNARWIATCSHGVTQAMQEVKTGEVERRRQALIAATQVAVPENGLQDAAIAGLYTEGRNTVGAGGYMTGYVVSGYLYLKDGTVRRDFDKPPAMIVSGDVPALWGKWTREGDRITITWGGGKTETVDVTASNLMVGGPEGMRLDGHYRHVSGGGTMAFGGGSTFLSEQDYRFHADGTFESGRSSSFLTGPGPASEGATAAGGSTGPGTQGHYQVEGYTLRLTYPDGRVMRLGFAAYAHELGDPARGGLMLNGTFFFRDSKG